MTIGTANGSIQQTNLTPDGVLYADANGIVHSTAAGTSTQVLTSNGAGNAPTFQAPGGAGFPVLIQSQSVSGSSVTFTTGFGGYSYYLLEFFNIVLSTDNSSILLQISTNGGSTYVNSGYDQVSGENYIGVGASVATFNGSSNGQFTILGAIGNSGNCSSNGTVNLYGLDSSSVFKKVLFNCCATQQAVTTSIHLYGAGNVQTSAVVNALNFTLDTGTFSAGTVRLFGIH